MKYVPVKVKTTDLDALKANHTVVENGGTLVGGYGENQLNLTKKLQMLQLTLTV